MKSKYLLCSFVLLLSLWGCSNISEEGESNEPIYFPLKEFVEVLVENVEGKSLLKEVIINGERERVTTIPSEEEWLKELSFFIEADINSPALAQSYKTDRSENILVHELKEGEKGKVKRIVVKYHEDKVTQISFRMKTENPFYSSETKGLLVFHAESGKLDQFSIDNYQDVVFSKPNKLIISASVID
ncbi:MAG: hypothetical protein EA341_11200 [Mongoliibacter sp.]|uniref:hypothetical protein n=1 Tax=Mongoliibacter sp. TaxID=2022438 RepID=UPI0012EFD3E7|nr:hypothetical protein [Mongoliibacter sp.]TVP48285.1 MAG: hypothetical protein EA341_11200 [Mongoliibacter sp.]